jgi:hypothetical protein
MSKDWFGNQSFFIQNHRKKDSEVSKADFYATNPISVRSLLQVYPFKEQLVWEPACGTGNISRVLKEAGHKVFSTDLIDRGYGDGTMNFLQQMKLPQDQIDYIITNPPYKWAEQFLEQAMNLLHEGNCYIAFLPITFLEGKKRYELYKKYPPSDVYIFSSRQGCSSKGEFEFDNGGARCYCWIIWQKGFSGDPTLRWIPPN